MVIKEKDHQAEIMSDIDKGIEGSEHSKVIALG